MVSTTLSLCMQHAGAFWKNCSGYHRHSLVETKMHCIKRLDEQVMSRTFERQVSSGVYR